KDECGNPGARVAERAIHAGGRRQRGGGRNGECAHQRGREDRRHGGGGVCRKDQKGNCTELPELIGGGRVSLEGQVRTPAPTQPDASRFGTIYVGPDVLV